MNKGCHGWFQIKSLLNYANSTPSTGPLFQITLNVLKYDDNAGGEIFFKTKNNFINIKALLNISLANSMTYHSLALKRTHIKLVHPLYEWVIGSQFLHLTCFHLEMTSPFKEFYSMKVNAYLTLCPHSSGAWLRWMDFLTIFRRMIIWLDYKNHMQISFSTHANFLH